MRKAVLFTALAMLVAGCGSDNSVTGPSLDAAKCVKGSISAGDTKSGQLTTSSCPYYDYAYSDDSTYYDAFTFQAEKGKGYMITARGDTAAGMDMVIELVGRDVNTGQEQVLAISDDEGGNLASQVHFVAPTSGTFSLRVMGYSNSDTGSYALTAQSCRVPAARIDGAFSSDTEHLQSSDCVLSKPYFTSTYGDSSHVALYQIHFDANEQRTITVVSSQFKPAFELYGPGFDGLCYLSDCDGFSARNSNATDTLTYTFTANYPGDYTLAVGGSGYASSTGAFSLTVSGGSTGTPAPRVTNNPILLGKKLRVR